MKNTVEVVANKAGEVLTVSPKNAEYGWLTLKSETEEFVNGFLRFRTRFAFVPGTVKELEQFIAKHGIVENSTITGRIVVKESLVPHNAADPNIGIKYPSAAAKAEGLACVVDDQPVYRRTIFTQDTTMCDEFVAHTNADDIRAFAEEQRAKATVANTAGIKTRKPVGAK